MNPAVISPLNGRFRLEETFRVVLFVVLTVIHFGAELMRRQDLLFHRL